MKAIKIFLVKNKLNKFFFVYVAQHMSYDRETQSICTDLNLEEHHNAWSDSERSWE